MVNVTLIKRDSSVSLYIEENGVTNTITTDVDGAVRIWDTTAKMLDKDSNSTAKIDINGRPQFFLYDVWYHLYQVIDQMLTAIFENADVQTLNYVS